jgi:hypothetical protein
MGDVRGEADIARSQREKPFEFPTTQGDSLLKMGTFDPTRISVSGLRSFPWRCPQKVQACLPPPSECGLD